MNRTINLTVNSNGTVTCNGSLRPQIAGVQGDHNVCTVNFDLTAIWDGTANYFLEFVSGTNVPYILTTDSDGVTLDTTNHKISVVLSQEITADGGRVEVNVVQEKIDSENETSHESNTYTAYIYFEPKSGAIQKLKNTAYGIFADIKKTVTSFITTMTTAFNELSSAVTSLSNTKVDKVSGKGLSTNDYTTAEKTKLYGIEPGAEANVQSDWNESNSSADSFIKNKPITGVGVEIVTEYDEQADPYNLLKAKVDGVKTQFDDDGNITVNTEVIATKAFVRAVNDLANYYLKSETYNKTEVNQLIGTIPKFKIEVVNQLPTTDISTATVYLVTTGTESQNLYTEYIYVNNAWEKLGTQTVDLTGYATESWVNSQIADFLTANEISYAISTALNNYYNKAEVDDLLDYKVNIGTFNDLAAAVEDKVNKETGKGLSTNDFTNDYKLKIETNEYNDIFNIRVELDRQYMPYAELIAISFQEYRNGVLVNNTFYDNVKDITNGDVYLFKNISDRWAMAVGTPPSSYGRLPMLVGKIATKTVNGESVKLFFRNGDDETQFDKLNSEKVDKDLLVTLTQSEYDNLPSINPDAYYFIEEE